MVNKIKLPNVEIISINTHNPEQSVKAIEYSSRNFEFASKKIMSDIMPTSLPSDVSFVQIPKFVDRFDYSDFAFKELYDYTQSEFVLMIHDDGFIINPHLWNPDFLKYDYIGAPWPGSSSNIDYGRVGNGGFCIRSRRLLKATRELIYEPAHDDWIIGVTHNHILRGMGIHTAPVTLAMTFALELPIEECDYNLNNTFGFHSKRSQQHIDRVNLIQ